MKKVLRAAELVAGEGAEKHHALVWRPPEGLKVDQAYHLLAGIESQGNAQTPQAGVMAINDVPLRRPEATLTLPIACHIPRGIEGRGEDIARIAGV